MVAARGLARALVVFLALAAACGDEGPRLLIDLSATPPPTSPAASPTAVVAPSPTPACVDAASAEATAAAATVQVVAGTIAGSGVLVSPRGHVLTAQHVVRDQSLVVVLLPDGRRSVGRVVARDEASDMALVSLPLEGLPSLDWAPEEPEAGTPVLALGYPLPSQRGLGGPPTAADAVTAPTLEVGGQRFLPLQTRLNQGYSGGPVVDLCGRLVGLVLARLGDSRQSALALSLTDARPVAERLLQARPPTAGGEEQALAANMTVALGEGYLPSGRYVAVDAGGGQRLFALHGICLDSPDSYCQKVLFFVGTRYVGADTLRPSRLVLDVLPGEVPAEVIVVYPTYEPSDPACCPSGPPVPIPYTWDGERIRPGGVPPEH